MSAVLSSPAPGGFTREDRYLRTDGTVYLTGIQALVRVLFDRVRHDRRAGRRTAAFVSGYEGSPLAGFDLELGRRSALLAEHDVVHRPGLNEELAATSIMGSQLAGVAGELRPDGVVGLWYGKSPGLDRATDALRHANLVGTSPQGGAVALVGDDPVAKSSTVPCASELALADLAMPVFYPADPQDVLDHGLHAVELSRASGLWTAMKVVTNVADAAGTAVVRSEWAAPTVPAAGSARPYGHRPSGHLLGASLAALERSLYTARLPLATAYVRAGGVNRIERSGPGDRIGIVAAGKPYLDLRQALRSLGLDEAALARYGIRVLKLGVIHPVEPQIVREFAAGLAEIVVVEEKRAFVETAIKEILYGTPGAPAVHGKTAPDGTTLFGAAGELGPDEIAAGLARRLTAHEVTEPLRAWRDRRPRERVSLPLPARTAYFCSGCPHNSSTKVPEGTLVGAGIGCHAMALLMEPEQVGNVIGVTQMGGEGAQWIGMAPFVSAEHFTQNLGDGTFTHSGSLAVRAAVAAGVNITFKLLYNSAVAMTGGQQAVGGLPVEKITELLVIEGVAKVIITSDDPGRLRRKRLPTGVQVRHRDELERSQRELAATPGVTVLIHDQECATEKRRKRRRGTAVAPAARVVINERVCEGCGDCGIASNCLSVRPVDTEFGRKTRIHQASCNVDYSCLAGDCPSFLTVVPGGRRPRREIPDLAAGASPEPERRTAGPDFTVRITGVGGTGVVTVAQILATAAVMDGRRVRALDQTGLAQKGGAVVSDIKVTAADVAQAARLAAGECDLYLACDALVGADPAHLAAADPARTTAVVSTTEVPTGRMVVDPSVSFPGQDRIRSLIDASSAHALYLDARGLAERLFDDDQYANVLQLGAAYQAGALPVPAEAIERAIELNGVAVRRNLQAFRRGRQLVADPAALEAVLADPAGPATPAALADPGAAADGSAEPADPAGAVAGASVAGSAEAGQAAGAATRVRALVGVVPGTEAARLLDIRIPDLIAYQDEAYARTYAEYVERIRRLEDGLVPGATQVTAAVARNLYKLMAYKDEYEVARLCLDPGLTAGIRARFGDRSRYTYRLHPPVLRALGMKRKIVLGPWFRPVFRALHAMRRVRGTRLDPFGYARIRRIERALPGEYRDAVLRALSAATPADHTLLVELAGTPDMVRGYEDVKLKSVAAYRERQAELLAKVGR